MNEKRKTEKQKEKNGHPGASVSLFKPEMTSFTRSEVGKNLHIGKNYHNKSHLNVYTYIVRKYKAALVIYDTKDEMK